MVGHEGEQIEANVIKTNTFCKFIDKMLAISIRAKYIPAIITTHGHVVHCAFIRYS